MNIMSSKTFCIMPWIGVNTNPSGIVKPCCEYIHLGEDEIHFSNFNQYDKTNTIKKLKNDINNNIWNDGCINCKKTEDLKNISLRQKMNEKYEDILNSYTDEKLHFDFKFGNKCNLKCRMCSSFFSDQIYNEIKLNLDEDFLPDEISSYKMAEKIGTWTEDDMTYQILNKSLNKIQFLKLTGGEPLINNTVKKIIKKSIDTGDCKHIELQLITNGQSLNKELIDDLRNFKNVILSVSIDGIGDAYEYIRYPGKWKRIEKNIITLRENISFNFEFGVIITLQSLNILNVFDLIKFLEHNSIYYEISNVFKPEYNNVKYMPDDLKIFSLNKNKNKVNPHTYEIIKNYFEFSEDETIIHKFLNYTQIKDKIRNQNFNNYFPQESKFYEKYK